MNLYGQSICLSLDLSRLISEKTIEENILRKANQKRLLNEMTIEGGNFTTALLKRNLITELFEESYSSPANAKTAENDTFPVDGQRSEQIKLPDTQQTQQQQAAHVSDTEFEKALAMVEDESDVMAADQLRKEVKADSAEFDENQQFAAETLEDAGAEDATPKLSRVESEFQSIEKQVFWTYVGNEMFTLVSFLQRNYVSS